MIEAEFFINTTEEYFINWITLFSRTDEWVTFSVDDHLFTIAQVTSEEMEDGTMFVEYMMLMSPTGKVFEVDQTFMFPGADFFLFQLASERLMVSATCISRHYEYFFGRLLQSILLLWPESKEGIRNALQIRTTLNATQTRTAGEADVTDAEIVRYVDSGYGARLVTDQYSFDQKPSDLVIENLKDVDLTWEQLRFFWNDNEEILKRRATIKRLWDKSRLTAMQITNREPFSKSMVHRELTALQEVNLLSRPYPSRSMKRK